MKPQCERVWQLLLSAWIIWVNLLFYFEFFSVARADWPRVVQFMAELLGLR